MAGNRNSGGRNAKSARLHILQGTFRKDRFDGDAPDPPTGDPEPPGRLGAEARKEWNRLLERLRQSRTLSTVDDGALYCCAKQFARVEALERKDDELELLGRQLRREAKKLQGDALATAIGHILSLERQRARLDAQIRQGSMALRMWYVEFGLTPSARTRVKAAPEGKPRDPAKQAFLAGLNLA